MKNINSTILFIIIVCFPGFSFGQDTLRLSHDEFLAIVKNYHPLAFRYQLQKRIAADEIQKARGNFDPLVNGKNGAKTIDGLNYYKETNIELGIPTWYGIELNGNYNHIDGQKLNNSTTKGGLFQFGITLPLAKNLLYDKRRALLDQARIGLQMTEAEQQVLTNQLMLDAENIYWDWVKQYEVYQLQARTIAVNRNRLKLTQKTLEYGERAAIDTTEALSQLQSFELQLEDAYLKLVKATQELSLFMWTKNREPYDPNLTVAPADNLIENHSYQNYHSLLTALETQPLNQHAAVRYYTQKNRILESERRLKQQSLLPKLDFTYNFFNKEQYKADYFPLFQNNYQYGLKLEIPLLLREARADYKIARSKIEQNQLDTDYKQQELHTKITAYKNEVINYRNQIDIAQQNIINYRRLLNAEETRFGNGESSLFLINSRENKLLEAEQKLIELRLKFVNSYNQLKWLNENFNRPVLAGK
jgi:outer membrane protein TolC